MRCCAAGGVIGAVGMRRALRTACARRVIGGGGRRVKGGYDAGGIDGIGAVGKTGGAAAGNGLLSMTAKAAAFSLVPGGLVSCSWRRLSSSAAAAKLRRAVVVWFGCIVFGGGLIGDIVAGGIVWFGGIRRRLAAFGGIVKGMFMCHFICIFILLSLIKGNVYKLRRPKKWHSPYQNRVLALTRYIAYCGMRYKYAYKYTYKEL